MGAATTLLAASQIRGPLLAAIAVFSIIFGTNLLHYAVAEPSMSHIYSFGAIGLMLWTGGRFWLKPSYLTALALGAVIGLVVSIRHYDAAMAPLVLYPAFMKPNWPAAKRFGLVVTGGAVLALLPHIVVATYYLGAPWANTYWAVPSLWNSPEIANVLFSVRKGWWFWTPMAALGCAGLVAGIRTEWRWLCICGLAGVSIIVFLVSVWPAWSLGHSFGARGFVDVLPVVAIGLVFIFDRVVKRPVRFVSIGGLILLNLSLTGAYWNGHIPGDGTTWKTYTRIVQMPFRSLMDIPEPRDSRVPLGLAADVSASKLRLDSEGAILTTVARNTGSTLWLADPGKGQVNLVLRAFNRSDCQGPSLWEMRSGIPDVVPPEQKTELVVRINSPLLNPPFRYLCVEMLAESVIWFSDLGSRPAIIDMNNPAVTGKAARQ